MCGRYASSRKPDDLVEEFGVTVEVAGACAAPEADYNIAPTKTVAAVLERGPESSLPGRQLRAVRWGLVPSWAKDRSIGARLINARVETLAEKPAFRKALVARRCLLPADGWYEWQRGTGPDGRPRKTPWFLHRADGGGLAFAGLYEIWRDPEAQARGLDPDDPAGLLWSATVITTAAEPALAEVHDRMPLWLPPERWDAWLDPTSGEVRALLAPPPPDLVARHPVDPAVGKVATHGPSTCAPVDAEPADAPAVPAAEPLTLFG